MLQPYYIPLCCGASTSSALSNKNQYPNFFRTITSDTFASVAITDYIVKTGWSRISIIYTDDDYGNSLLSSVLSRVAAQKVLTDKTYKFPLRGTSADADLITANLKMSDVRIVVFLGWDYDYITIVKSAITNGVFGKGYAWMVPDGCSNLVAYQGDVDFTGTLFFFPLEKSLGVDNNPIDSSIPLDSTTFNEYWKTHRLDTTFDVANQTALDASKPFVYFFASCLDLLVLGFDRLLKSNDTYTIEDLISRKLNPEMSFPSTFSFPDSMTASGYVKLNEDGDRIGDYNIYNFQVKGSPPVVVATWSETQVTSIAPFVYPGRTAEKPLAYFVYEIVFTSADPTGQAIIFTFVFSSVLFFISILTTLIFRKKPIMFYTNYPLSLLCQLCLWISSVEIIMYLDKPNEVTCAFQLLLFRNTFSFYTCIQLIKSHQIYLECIKGYPAIKNRQLIQKAFFLNFPMIMLSIVWLVLDSPIGRLMIINESLRTWECVVGNIGFYIDQVTWAYLALMVSFNLALNYLLRNIQSAFEPLLPMAMGNLISFLIIVFKFIMPNVSLTLDPKTSFITNILPIAIITIINITVAHLFKLIKLKKLHLNSNPVGNFIKTDKLHGNFANQTSSTPLTLVRYKQIGGWVSWLTYSQYAYIGLHQQDTIVIYDLQKPFIEDVEHLKSIGRCWNIHLVDEFKFANSNQKIVMILDQCKIVVEFFQSGDLNIWLEYLTMLRGLLTDGSKIVEVEEKKEDDDVKADE
ncbi:hypothetical protein HDV02_001924 [Globomyces sp. JEL0801]|nr:hypothetical protein HDV02_001924 [Globomyces sp. JEL0801]